MSAIAPRAFTAATTAAASSRRAVRCSAVMPNADRADPMGRRAALLLAAGAAAIAVQQPRAWALIPDEEDEELLERAKANRSKRLAAQKETTRDFLREEGLKDKQLDSELVGVQKAVFKLAQSGSQLEAGDVKGAASTLGSGGWVEEFQRATAVLNASDAESGKAAAVFDGIAGLKASASKGDLKGSKQNYVALVAALQDWATSTGLAGDLKGL